MNVYINKKKTFQTFEGFGASGAWWAQEVGGWEHKDAESNLAVRDRISQLLYSKTEGIGLRTYRYNIGGGSKQSNNGKIKEEIKDATEKNSIYYRAAKPYLDAKRTLIQASNYSHFDDIKLLYADAKARLDALETEQLAVK